MRTAGASWRRDPILLAVPAALALLALFVVPLMSLISSSVVGDDGLTLSRYADALSDGQFWAVVTKTLRIAALVTLLTAVLGFPFAYVATRLPKPWGYLMLALLALPLATPTLVRSFVWLALLSPNGPVHSFAASIFGVELPQMVYTDLSVVLGMSFVLLPMMVLPMYSRMRSIDPGVLMAAQSLGADPFSAWRSVYLPLAVPGVAAGASIVFLFSLGFYTTPMLLGGAGAPVIAQRIDVQMRALQSYGPTSAEAAILLAGAIGLMVLLRRHLGVVSATESPGRRRGLQARFRSLISRREPTTWGVQAGRVVSFVLSRLRHVFVIGGALLTTAFLLVPIGMVVMFAFNDSAYLTFPPEEYSTRWFTSYFSDASWMSVTLRSLVLAGVATLVATLLGTCASFGLVRSRARRLPSAAYVLAMCPMVMPQILYAVALYFFFARAGLVGTDVALILGYVILALPFAVIVTTMVARSLDPLVERAAASLGASPWKVGRDIILPLALPGILASLLFGFVVAFDDLALAVFLGGPFNVTLQVRMYENLRFEISPQVASVGVLLIALTLTVGLLFYLFSARRMIMKRLRTRAAGGAERG
jgi:putative spermidine/putrescine transport system permease protein